MNLKNILFSLLGIIMVVLVSDYIFSKPTDDNIYKSTKTNISVASGDETALTSNPEDVKIAEFAAAPRTKVTYKKI